MQKYHLNPITLSKTKDEKDKGQAFFLEDQLAQREHIYFKILNDFFTTSEKEDHRIELEHPDEKDGKLKNCPYCKDPKYIPDLK